MVLWIWIIFILVFVIMIIPDFIPMFFTSVAVVVGCGFALLLLLGLLGIVLSKIFPRWFSEFEKPEEQQEETREQREEKLRLWKEQRALEKIEQRKQKLQEAAHEYCGRVGISFVSLDDDILTTVYNDNSQSQRVTARVDLDNNSNIIFKEIIRIETI